jgi:hypothetical protein
MAPVIRSRRARCRAQAGGGIEGFVMPAEHNIRRPDEQNGPLAAAANLSREFYFHFIFTGSLDNRGKQTKVLVAGVDVSVG